MSVNKVILVGRLGAEPESRAFPNGGSVCNIRLATTQRWKDKSSGEQKEATEWHRITLQNRLGEIAQQYLHKGSQVYIEGRIQTRKWQDQSGQDRYSTEIIGNELKMLDSKQNDADRQQAQVNRQYGAPEPEQAAPAPQGGGDYLDDSIPFVSFMKFNPYAI